jgi:hypothetical protein
MADELSPRVRRRTFAWRPWLLLVALRRASGASVGHGSGHIDRDTPEADHHRLDKFGRRMDLVMSDEFSIDGRKFGEGDDPMWTATHNVDKTNRAWQRIHCVARAGLCLAGPPPSPVLATRRAADALAARDFAPRAPLTSPGVAAPARARALRFLCAPPSPHAQRASRTCAPRW